MNSWCPTASASGLTRPSAAHELARARRQHSRHKPEPLSDWTFPQPGHRRSPGWRRRQSRHALHTPLPVLNNPHAQQYGHESPKSGAYLWQR